jgi:spoIIIJ-associated protein
MSLNKATLDRIKKETENLLSLLGVKLESKVSADLDGVQINLSGTDSAIMIGRHGENLAAFAYLLSVILHKEIGREISIRVDINNYLKEKDKKITDMVLREIEKVKKSGFPEEMSGFNAYERRIAHTVVAKEGLLSESRGYGVDRILVIKPRSIDEEDS